MSQQPISPEITFTADHSDSKATVRKILKTTLILSVITIIELALGFTIYKIHNAQGHEGSPGLIMFMKGVIVILSLAKAFYIVSIFMHLGDELRNMIMTIIVPLLLFIWFITAFLWDGHSYKNLRNDYDAHHKEQTNVKPSNQKPADEHGAGHGEEHGEKPGAVH